MAYYDFKKKPALTTKEGEKDVLYPSIVFNGTINTKQLLKQLVARTGYKPGVVEGTLMELVDLVGEYIGQGYRVEVGEFGIFSGKIKFLVQLFPTKTFSPAIFHPFPEFLQLTKGKIIKNIICAEIDQKKSNPLLLFKLIHKCYLMRMNVRKGKSFYTAFFCIEADRDSLYCSDIIYGTFLFKIC